MKLSDFSTLSFDVYGTLIDWESGMIEGLRTLTDRLQRDKGKQLDRNQILEAHARLESTNQAFVPTRKYSDVLAIVYRRLAEEWGIGADWDECLGYGASVRNWPAFADSAKSLRYLKQHYKLVVLSNVDNLSFAYSNQRLGIEFDAIYTAEDIGSYKPSARNFEYMLDNLKQIDVGKSQLLHTAESMFHDHQPANCFELANCWINRRHDSKGFGATMDPGDMPNVAFTFNSMAELVEAHRAEIQS